MATLKKYSDKTLSEARKNGFKAKKPIMGNPQTEKAIDGKYKTFNGWVDRMSTHAKKYRDKEASKKRLKSKKDAYKKARG